jgi:hypothetical protein
VCDFNNIGKKRENIASGMRANFHVDDDEYKKAEIL